MATIEIKSEGDLLILSVTGNLTAEEIEAVIQEHYQKASVKDVIWDLTNGTIITISNSSFKDLVKAVKESLASGARQGGKTAYVGSADVEYGILHMCSAFADMAKVPISYNVFRTIEKARSWISS